MSVEFKVITVHFSKRKLAVLEASILLMTTLALWPGARKWAVYTSIFFTPTGSILRYICAAVLLAIAGALLPAFLSALFEKPALVISADAFTVRNFKARRYGSGNIYKVENYKNGDLGVILKGGVKVGLPFSIYRKSAAYDEAKAYFLAMTHFH